MGPLFRVLFKHLVDDLDADDATWTAAYEGWAQSVRASVEPGRLIEWQPGDGWTPLCRALDLPVPDLPFPHENSSADYAARQQNRAERDRQRVAARRPYSS